MKKLFLIILIAVVGWAFLNFTDYGNKVKGNLITVYKSGLIQEGVADVKSLVGGIFGVKAEKKEENGIFDNITESDRKVLEGIIKEEVDKNLKELEKIEKLEKATKEPITKETPKTKPKGGK